MNKKYTGFIIVLTFLMLVVGIYFLDGPGAIKKVIATAKIEYLRTVIALLLSYYIMQALILKEITNNVGENLSFFKSFKALMIGEFFSAITPLATGGQPMQVLYMGKNGINSGKATSILGISLFFYHIGRMVLALVLTFSFFGFFYAGGYSFTFFIILGIILNLALSFFMLVAAYKPHSLYKFTNGAVNLLYKLKIVKNKEKIRQKVQDEVSLFYLSVREFRGQSFVIYLLLLIQNIISFIFYFGISYFIFLSFDIELPSFLLSVAAQSTVSLVSAYVPMPGGSGGAEGIFYMLFSALIPKGAPIFLAILLWRVVSYYFTIIFAFPFTLKLK